MKSDDIIPKNVHVCHLVEQETLKNAKNKITVKTQGLDPSTPPCTAIGLQVCMYMTTSKVKIMNHNYQITDSTFLISILNLHVHAITMCRESGPRSQWILSQASGFYPSLIPHHRISGLSDTTCFNLQALRECEDKLVFSLDNLHK